MTGDLPETVHRVAARLAQQGHTAEAARLRAAVPQHGVGTSLLHGLDTACQTVLTAIEAIDPVSATMIEELRLEIDKRLR